MKLTEKETTDTKYSNSEIRIRGAWEHNLKGLNLRIQRNAITVITGVSGSGKSSLAFDTILAESQRRFFYTLSHYTRQFLDLGSKPAVEQISGLSPAISLSQNETTPSRLATVGTLTDISELLSVIMARFGTQKCPKHNLICAISKIEDITDHMKQAMKGKNIAIFIPFVDNKKGHFAQQLTQFAEKGYESAYVDGKIVSLNPIPELEKSEKHTIKILVDVFKVQDSNEQRLIRALERCFKEADQQCEYWEFKSKTDLSFIGSSSTKSGCPTCGFSWPKLDSRYFSANSLGKCKSCKGWGIEEISEEDEDFIQPPVCSECQGTGVQPNVTAIDINGNNIHDFLLMSLEDLLKTINTVNASYLKNNPAFMRVSTQIVQQLGRLNEIGLGYLSLSRRILTLSGGEKQRLRLADILGENLRGVLYILDEPSQGLHPSEVVEIWGSIEQLKNSGNTVIIIDHDQQIIERADHIIDLGPGGGERGGEIMAMFSPKHAKSFAKQSLTASFLSGVKSIEVQNNEVRKSADDFLTIKKPRLNNLKMDAVNFQKGAINVVSGVSGAGKSSLVRYTLYANLSHLMVEKRRKKSKSAWIYCDSIQGFEDFKYVHLIDRKPLARSTVSMPISYLDVLADVRSLFAELPQAQIAGLTARDFSIHTEGGRCEECKGRGEVNLSMRFLADARVTCPICEGNRFRPAVLEVKYNDMSINDVFELTIDGMLEKFKNFKRIVKKLTPAQQIGLGYLKLGQPSISLSGGEAQRLKLVPFLTKSHGKETLLIIEEPTMGLHFQDVEKIISIFHDLAARGSTLIIIEHNTDVINHADRVIDIGPGAAEKGGNLLYQGPPAKLSSDFGSVTSAYLQ